MRVRDRIPVVVALVLAGLSVALLWVPWVPLDRHYDCGWTCYLPVSHVRLIEVSGRGGLAIAPVGSVLVLIAAMAVVALRVTADRPVRSIAVFALVCGIAGGVATGLELARVLRADFIELAPRHPGTGVIGGADAALGVGAVVAILIAVAVCAMAAERLVSDALRGRSRAPGLRATREAPPA